MGFSIEETPEDVPGRTGKGFSVTDATTGYGEDIKKSAISAAVTAPHSVFGQIGDWRDLLGRAADYMTEKSGQPRGPRINTWLDMFPNTADIKNATGVGSKYDYESQTLPGALTGGVVGGAATVAAGGLPGLIRGGLARAPGYAADVLRYGGAPGIGSVAAGQTMKEINPDFQTAAEIAGGAGSSMLAKKAISPNLNTSPPVSAATHAQHVDILDRSGLGDYITAGERANDTMQRRKESQLDPKHFERSREAITAKSLGAIDPKYAEGTIRPGIPAEISDTGVRQPGTLERIRTEVGKRIGDVTGRNFIDYGASGYDLGNGMDKMVNDYRRTMGYDKGIEAKMRELRTQIDDMFANHGPHPTTGVSHIPGEAYQNMTSDLFRKQKEAFNSGNSDLGAAYQQTRKLLDDAFEKSVKVHNNPDLNELQKARDAWRAYLTVSGAQGGSAATISHLTPAAINREAAHVYGDTQQAENRTPFYWAPSAHTVMRTEPDTASGSNLAASVKRGAIGSTLFSTAAGLYGAKHGMNLSDMWMQLAGSGGAGAAVGYLGLKPLEKALYMSDAGRKYHGNQLMANTPGVVSPLGLLGLEAQTEHQSPEERKQQWDDFFSNKVTPEEAAKRTPRRTSVRGLLNQIPGSEPDEPPRRPRLSITVGPNG